MRILSSQLFSKQANQRILELLKENPRKQYTAKEIIGILNLCKSTTHGVLRRFRKTDQIVVKRVGRYTLFRINDPTQIPILHQIEKPKPRSEDKKVKGIDRKVHVPKKIRQYLNWEEGEQILFIKEDKQIILKVQ